MLSRCSLFITYYQFFVVFSAIRAVHIRFDTSNSIITSYISVEVCIVSQLTVGCVPIIFAIAHTSIYIICQSLTIFFYSYAQMCINGIVNAVSYALFMCGIAFLNICIHSIRI